MDSAERFVTLVIGMISIIGLLIRIAYTIGKMTTEFVTHVKLAEKIHKDQETRIRQLEQRRR